MVNVFNSKNLKKSLFILFILSATNIYGQNRITINENNPYLNNIYSNALVGINTKLGPIAGLKAKYYLAKAKLCVDGEYTHGLFKGWEENHKKNSNTNLNYLNPIKPLKAARLIEFGILYNFSIRNAKVFTPVFVTGNSRGSFFSLVKANHLVTKGVRLGLGAYRHFKNVSITPDLPNYGAGLNVDPSINNYYPNTHFSILTAASNTQYLSLGMQRSSIKNFSYRTFSNTFTKSGHTQLYIDALFNLNSNLSKVRVNNDSREFDIIALKVNSMISKSGFRVGYINHPPRFAYFSLNLELGSLPGYRISWAASNSKSLGNFSGSFYFIGRIGIGLTSKKFGSNHWSKIVKKK